MSVRVTERIANQTQHTLETTIMAAEYGFSEAQMEQLHELLNPKYSDMWATLIQ